MSQADRSAPFLISLWGVRWLSLSASVADYATKWESFAMIRPALHHVTMKTARLGEMVAWYGLLIGAECNFQGAQVAWMSNDAANHRIAFLSAPGMGDDPDRRHHSGMHHSAFEYDSFDDLMTSWKRLDGKGVSPAFCLDHGLTISIYYKDPDGNFVELQSDNFGDWALSTNFMRTSDDFASNPIGSFFDPAKVFAAHRGGMAFAELQRGMRAGDFSPPTTPDMGMPNG